MYNFGRDLLKSIKTDMDNGEKVEPARMYAVTLLGSILKYAFELGYIKHNPYYGIKNSKCK